MKNILSTILEYKKKEVASNKKLVPVEKLKDSIYYSSNKVSLKQYILRKDKCGIIAEFKRKSPSQPNINLYANPEEISRGYMQSGASALSILTDKNFFGGSSTDLTIARKYNYCPILRKDFIIDEYQLHEAKSIGADAILLIAELLSKDDISTLSSKANEIGLEVLLEIHAEDQIDKITTSIDIIGVNNRDLKTFNTDLNNSIRLSSFLPDDICKISESGIQSAEQMIQLKSYGFDGFLIGKTFMESPDPVKSCAKLVNEFSFESKEIVI